MRGTYQRYVIIVMSFILCAVGSSAVGKATPHVIKLSGADPIPISPGYSAPMFRLADTCSVDMAGPAAYYIPSWVIGNDLYKAYQDPVQTCERPYPFTIDIVYFLLQYLSSDTIFISVDIESADMTDPSCPKPGSLLTISPLYQVNLENNLYMIQIPLDSPVVVNGPYFVGLYFAEMGNPYDAAVVTDSIPVPCVSYNDWGEGYVDLDTVTNDLGQRVFPGRLIIYSGGITGGTGGPDPEPAARFIHPAEGQFLGTWIDLWANDAAGSESIDRADFHYWDNADWVAIGFNTDDNPPLRNGVDPSGTGNGLAYLWNTTGLTEDDYQLRVVVTDTLGRADTAEATAHIDPTPPFPTIDQPAVGQNICDGVTVRISCPDEDISYVSFDRKSIPRDFTVPISVVGRQLGGDIDGDPADGNSVAEGEYGDYCSGPAAAAMMIKYWYDRGYTFLLRENQVFIHDTLLMDRLFEAMNIQANRGAYDEEVVSGLNAYIVSHYDDFDTPIDRSPTLAELFAWMGDYEYTVMVGISGDPGFWMTAAGSVGMIDASGYAVFKMADPATAAVGAYSVREDAGKLWILYDSIWREIDILVGMIPRTWSVARQNFGIDVIGADGWETTWNPSSLSQDSLYYIYVAVYDVFANKGFASVLVQYDCTVNGVAGDINHDSLVNAADIVFMTNFLYLDGPPPPGGYGVTDVNCDGVIGLADIIYLFNYLYNGGPAPCL